MTEDPKKNGVPVGGNGTAPSAAVATPQAISKPAAQARPVPPAPQRTAPVTSQGLAARAQAATPDEEIAAALEAGHHERAADLLQRHGERLLAEGAEAPLVRWFEQLPNAMVGRRPRLALLHAWLLVYQEQYPGAATRISEAERALRALEMSGARGWPEDGDEVIAIQPFAEIKRAIRAVRGHLAWIHGDSRRLPESVDEVMLASSADHPVWRARALVTLGRCRYLAGALADAAQDLEAAVACTAVSGQRLARSVGLEAQVGLGRVREAQGALDQAAKLYADVIRQAGDAPEHADVVAGAQIGLGRVALAHCDMDAAEAALARGLTRADATAWLAVALDGHIAWAWVQHARGRRGEVKAALDRADRFVKARDRRWAAEIVTTQRARLLLAAGDIAAVRRWQQAFAMRGEDRLGPIREAQRVTQGLILTALGDAEGAATVLAAARREAAAAGLVALAVEAAVADARCQFARGKRQEAAAALADAVALAAPASLIHPFVAQGPLPAELLATLPKAKSEAERTLLAAIARPPAGAAAAKPATGAKATGAKTKPGKPSAIATEQAEAGVGVGAATAVAQTAPLEVLEKDEPDEPSAPPAPPAP